MSSTPGPWTFVPWHIEEGPPAVRAPEGWIVCTTSSDDDARLIAAAPDMAGALEKLANEVHALRAFEDDVRYAIGNTNLAVLMKRLDEARAALAKAGVTPPVRVGQ